jgi:hypothetical protein
MTQLTSAGAIFLFADRSPQVTECSLPNIRDEPLLWFSPSSLPMMGQPVLFMFRLLFAARSSMSYLAVTALSFGYAPRRKGGVDSNHLAHLAAARFYCEYRTRERIHRDVADSRLLAIPASWGQVAAPNPNWGEV